MGASRQKNGEKEIMSFTVVEADIKKNLDVVVSLFNRNRKHQVGRERFQWLYLRNPGGEARAWFVRDERTKEYVAFTSVLPRLVKVGNTDVACWNCCDFSVDIEYRTLGIALKLRRKAKECVDSGEIQALYAHPNDRMQIIHEKVGHRKIGEMIRLAKPLRSERHINRLIKNQLLSRLLSSNVDRLLAIKDILIRCKSTYCIEWTVNDKFDDRYNLCVTSRRSSGSMAADVQAGCGVARGTHRRSCALESLRVLSRLQSLVVSLFMGKSAAEGSELGRISP